MIDPIGFRDEAVVTLNELLYLAVVASELQVGVVDRRRVAAGLRHAAAKIVGYHDGRTSGERLQHPDVGADPRGEILGVLQARSGLSVMCSVGCPPMIRSVEANASGTLG